VDEASVPDAPASQVLSKRKRLLGLASLVAVIMVCGSLGLMLAGGPDIEADAPSVASTVALLLFAAAATLVGLAIYGIAYATRCLTFRFDRPFFPGYRWRAWVFKLAYELPLQTAFAFACAPSVVAALYGRLPGTVVTVVGLGAPFVLAQFVMIWLNSSAPMDLAAIARRMRALGFDPERVPGGLPMGVSNPDRSSFKKFPCVEEDIGMLWLSATHVSFRGDAAGWDVPRNDVLAVERKADAGASSSYFGAIQVLLRIRRPDGTEHRVRLHPEGAFTQSTHAAALNTLAQRLEYWFRIDSTSLDNGPHSYGRPGLASRDTTAPA
jgi:hypothetical protein